MKKFLPFLVGLAICIMPCTYAAAQTTVNQSSQDIVRVSVYKPVTTAKSTNEALYSINIKAVRYFMKTYPLISTETWEKIKDGFVAKFVSNGIEIKNFFDLKGNWLHSIQRYDESKLPKRIRTAVKIDYYDYSITQVQEINDQKSFQDPVYLITFNTAPVLNW